MGEERSRRAGGKITYSMLIEKDSQTPNEGCHEQLCHYTLHEGQADCTYCYVWLSLDINIIKYNGQDDLVQIQEKSQTQKKR